MITFEYEGGLYELTPNGSGFYKISGIQLNEALRPGNFTRANNGAWVGHFTSEKGRYGGTWASVEMTISYLCWAGCTEIKHNECVIVVTRAPRAETVFGEKLIKSMGEVYNVIPQYPVCGGKYRIDFYIPETRQAFEYDEPHHKRNAESDTLRQREIEEELGCVFIRIPH